MGVGMGMSVHDPDAGEAGHLTEVPVAVSTVAGEVYPAARAVGEAGAPNAVRDARRPLLLVVLGATATGKTALSIALAQQLDKSGEIVNADSRYFYVGMDVGTAKPTLAERAGIPHHLIDTRHPLQGYSLAEYVDEARTAIADLHRRGIVPIVTGGTPQYLRALLEGWNVPDVPPDPELRARLERLPVAEVYAQLLALDPASAERIGPHNARRMIRAIEVTQAVGQPASVAGTATPPAWDALVLGLRMEREPLYARIDARVAAMHDAGWLEEVAALAAQGVTADTPAMSAHGYREVLRMLEGGMTRAEAITSTCFLTHRYVRHQETWFRRFANVTWLDAAAPDVTQQATTLATEWMAARSG